MSTSPSPPTSRVLQILETLARDPERSLTASEITSAVGIAPATGHAILTTLVQSGYLLRDDGTRAYRLGPALLAVGDAARRSFPLAAQLRDQLEQLSDELDLPCMAGVRDGDEIVIVEHVGIAHGVHPGQRFPCAPPFGAAYVAWEPRDIIDDWLDRARDPDVSRRAYVRGLADLRATGYSVGPLDDAVLRLRELLQQDAGALLSDRARSEAATLLTSLQLRDYTAADLEKHDALAVSLISAPVFGADRRTTAVVSVQVVRDGVPVREIRRLGKTLVRATTAMRPDVHRARVAATRDRPGGVGSEQGGRRRRRPTGRS